MNPHNTHHPATLHSLRNGDDSYINSFIDSDDYIEKVASILQSLGAERLPPLNSYDAVTHMSYRDIFFTELTIAVGDYMGFDEADEAGDDFVVEIGALLTFGETLGDLETGHALELLDKTVEPLRATVAEPAYIEVSDQGDYNVWLILPLTAASIEADGITNALTKYLDSAMSLHNELRHRLENGR